ncbi:MAG: hypothetical protein JKY37_03735 [Nannocystaceae bacterium]|nr:hypothetical protein [Nannocystaceae bacterium]
MVRECVAERLGSGARGWMEIAAADELGEQSILGLAIVALERVDASAPLGQRPVGIMDQTRDVADERVPASTIFTRDRGRLSCRGLRHGVADCATGERQSTSAAGTNEM